jgi:hypothetical protein
MDKMSVRERNPFIDAVKGITLCAVIFIHTCFWSGQSYVPGFMRNISLLVDVPIFFFLSGMTCSGNIGRTFKRLVNLQVSYMLFVTLFFCVCAPCNNEIDFTYLLNWYIHDYENSAPFPVVMGSMWYLQVYFSVALLGTFCVRYLSPKWITLTIALLLCGIVVMTIGRVESIFNSLEIPGLVRRTVFYLPIFLLGVQMKNINIKPRAIYFGCFLIFIFFAAVYVWYGCFPNVQKSKFPPHAFYFLWSIPSLFAVAVCKSRMTFAKAQWLIHIGKNSLSYYFAQGIAASLLYLFVRYGVNYLHWTILLPLMFMINLLLSVAIAEIYRICERTIRRIPVFHYLPK